MHSCHLRAPFALLVLTAGLAAFADDGGNHTLTIYSTATSGAVVPDMTRNGGGHSVPGYATVRHEREIALNAGRNTVRFTDVAGLIDPTTVSFTSLTDAAGTRVMEQNFQFDLVSPEKLYDKYLDREISVVLTRGDQAETVTGKLLSATGGQLVLQTAEGVRVLSSQGQQVKLGELPGGLITRPTLVWKLNSTDGGERQIQTTYQTNGITWRSDYNLVVNASDFSILRDNFGQSGAAANCP